MLNILAWRWRVKDGRLVHVMDSGGSMVCTPPQYFSSLIMFIYLPLSPLPEQL